MRTLVPTFPRVNRATRVRRAVVLALLAMAAVLLLVAVLLGAMRLLRPGVLPGVQVADLDVGGLSDAALISAVEQYAARREAAELTVALRDVEVTGTADELGYTLAPEPTAEAALYRGRQGNPFVALRDQVHSFWGTLDVQPAQTVDPSRLDAWLEGATAELTQPPVEGTLEFAGAAVTPVHPEPGASVDTNALRERLRVALLDPQSGNLVQAEVAPVTPETTAEAVDAVHAEAERAVSAPAVLTRDGATATFSPSEIGEALVVARDGGELRLDIDTEPFVAAIPPSTLETWTRPAQNAAFTVSGGSVSMTPSSQGFRFDPDAAADQLLALVTADGPREATVEGEVLEPELSTEEAEGLRIVEQVSSFTTEFAAGQSRVTNIRRIAELVDGTVLEPGETFSVNGHVGRRTEEKGFVGGGAIFDGEFVEQIGGGVSQFATTLYNAAYFGGYAIPEHKAHSYYISRYPVGREATLNFPDVDLKVRNNSPHGALIRASSSPTSVTVSFYGSSWVQVDSVVGERTNVTAPETQVRTTGDLPPGQERVVQEGREGFDIVVTRVLTFPDGRVEREAERTRYLPEPRIVERGA